MFMKYDNNNDNHQHSLSGTNIECERFYLIHHCHHHRAGVFFSSKNYDNAKRRNAHYVHAQIVAYVHRATTE